MLHAWQSLRQKNKLSRFLLPEIETQSLSFLISVCRLLLLVLFPTLFFFILGNFVSITRATFVLDYFLLAFLIPWLHRYILAFLFSLLFFLDVVFSVAPGYHFTFDTLSESLSSIPYLDISSLIGYFLILVFGTSLILWSTVKLIGTNRQKMGANVLILFLGFAVYVADDNFSPNNSKRNVEAATQTNISSSLVQTLRLHFLFAEKGNKKPSSYNVKSASGYIFDQISKDDYLPPRIVLVLVESLSLFKDDTINQLQFSSLENEELHKKYKIIEGTVPFNGSTVPGELRELCKVRVSAVLPDVSLLPVEKCLPKYLNSIGYESIAIHGFSGFFFSRNKWYPKLGFEKVMFMTDIDKVLGRKERCGSTFRASCDHSILSIIDEKLRDQERSKLFIYWLSINGHLPVSGADKIPHSVDCSDIETLRTNSALCSSVKIGESVVRGVAQIALNDNLPETLFVIVGDHMAPYLNKEVRATMSDSLVPFAVLIPKTKNK